MNKYFSHEINGLRGLAVAFVFLFHINQEKFYLGYIGVDIFFVISGYVITKLIYDKYKNDRFVITDFYANRFQRLYPALILFVFSGIILVLLFNISGNYTNFINTGISSLFGISNFYLNSIENNYFNPLDLNPFIHTWSLSIEFQFYVLYPFFLIFFLKIFKNENIIIFIIFLTILSIIILSNFLNLKSFYHTPARIWEPFIGCLAFFIKSNNKNFNNQFIIKILQIFLLFILFLNLSISLNILSSTLLSFLIILQTEKKNLFFNKILCTKIFQFLGNISYSIYLWHFLIIYFAETYFINIEYYFFSCLLTLIISSFSYFIIEHPLRKSNKIKKLLSYIFTKRKFFFIFIIIFTTLFFVDHFNLKNKIISISSKNIVSIFDNINIPKNSKLFFTQDKKLINNDCHEIYQNLDKLEQKKCYHKNNNKKLIYLFGDSHAWHFHPLFIKTRFETDLILSSYNNSSFFKPIFKDTINPFKESDKITKNLFKNLLSLSSKYSEIYLVLSFAHQTSYSNTNMNKKYFYEQEKYYLAFFNKLPKNIKIIFIKDTPIINHTESTCNAARYYNISFLNNNDRFKKCNYHKKNILDKLDKIFKMFENLSLQKNIYYLDFINYFCPTESCNFYHPEKKFALIYDGKHLNYETSIDLSESLKNQFSIILNK